MCVLLEIVDVKCEALKLFLKGEHCLFSPNRSSQTNNLFFNNLKPVLNFLANMKATIVYLKTIRTFRNFLNIKKLSEIILKHVLLNK